MNDSTGVVTLALEGRLDRSYRERFTHWINDEGGKGARILHFDLSRLQGFDSLGVGALIEAIDWARKKGIEVKLRSPDPHLLDYFSLLDLEKLLAPPKPQERKSALERLGEFALPFVHSLKTQFFLMTETVYWFLFGPWKKKGIRWDRVRREIVLVGVDAIPIVLLIAVLMGVILAIQASIQLRQFGATIYIADLVGISITREIGPLMTAIIVAGRSGSANAAEIGTMVVSEELDAVRQMGINPTRFLLVPKILALGIALPCLGVLAAFVGIASGALLAVNTLDIGMNAYLEETRQAIVANDLYSGLFKCLVFGLIVGATGCSQGLAVKGGAGEVGRATTVAVVVSIFLIIATDTIFTMVF